MSFLRTFTPTPAADLQRGDLVMLDSGTVKRIVALEILEQVEGLWRDASSDESKIERFVYYRYSVVDMSPQRIRAR